MREFRFAFGGIQLSFLCSWPVAVGRRWLLATVAALCAALPRGADACGAYFGSSESAVAETADQRIAIILGETNTTVFLQVGYRGDDPNFSWVIPTPSVLSEDAIAVVSGRIFDELHAQTAPRLVTFDDGCGAWGCAAEGESATVGVSVFASFVADGLEIVSLSADDSANLATWLDDNGYNVPAGAADVFAAYVDEGYAFVAVKVAGAAPSEDNTTTSDGTVAPEAKALQLTFAGAMAGVPLRLSSLSTKEEAEVLVYVVGSSRYDVANYPTRTVTFAASYEGSKDDFSDNYRDWLRDDLRTDIAFGVEYFGEVNAYTHTYLSDDVPEVAYVTRLRAFLTAADMDRDLVLQPTTATLDESYTRVRVSYGGPEKMAAVPWDLLAIAGYLSFAGRRRRARGGRS